MAFEDFLLFLAVAEDGKDSGAVLSTSNLAARFNFSQQSASRKLREFEKLGLISRRPTPKGTEVRLTLQGKDFLKQVSAAICAVSCKKEKDYITGTVSSGKGEGTYYTSISQYSKQFCEKLGFEAFPGTLNVKVNQKAVENLVDGRIPVIIHGFGTMERSFGGIKCFRARIGKNNELVHAVMIFPDRSNHPSGTIELISPLNLRKELSLTDGSKIRIYPD